ncbi:MAG TPA: TIR domain-containing protein [Longimicrobium sp.]|jgi:hypothetical protein|nr:TIR domain-containing protein [Longimicrobium sp.]
MMAHLLAHDAADQEFARRLAARLADAGAVVWLGQGGRETGEPLGAELRGSVAAAGPSLVVVSKSSVASDWLNALALDRATVPVAIDACELPGALADAAVADFRDPDRFEAAVEGLIERLDLPAGARSGVAIEWTDAGPGIFARGVDIPPSEGRALLDSWRALLPDLVARQKESGPGAEEVGPAANLLAVTRAFGDRYGRVPAPLELAAGTSELARKFDVLYVFFNLLYEHAAPT